MLDSLLLSAIVFFPLVGVVAALAVRSGTDRAKDAIRWITLVTFVCDFVLSVKLWLAFDRGEPGMQLAERVAWIPAFGIDYSLGVDGLSILLVMLTTFLAPLVMLGSWNSIQDRVKGFCVSLMLLQTGMLGAFLAVDLFLFYVFWELMLVPLYFIVGIWGGARRIYAAIKLFVFTVVGSLLMLIAILYLGFTHGTFDVVRLYDADIHATQQLWLFGFFALAFAIKVPMFPFHTWLPDAHVEAPTAGSVVLAGVLLKMGTYGFMRFAMPLFPEALQRYSGLLAVLAVVGIVYGALVAMVQPDVKKLVAYSSVSHLGYVILGLVALQPVERAGQVVYAPVEQGVQGGILQMVNHGLSTGALFLLVGMIYERRHTRMIRDFGGIAKVMPGYAFLFMMITLSSIGLPGLNGFVGELLILLGAFKANVVLGALAATGVVLGAAYMLWMFRRVFFGPITKEENRTLKDVDGREAFIISAILLFVIWIGVHPSTFLSMTTESVDLLVERSTSATTASGAVIRITGLRPVAPGPRAPEARGDRGDDPRPNRVQPRPSGGEDVPQTAPPSRSGRKRILLQPGPTRIEVTAPPAPGLRAGQGSGTAADEGRLP
jgi:NADH-quinone oxidoreductase subunit M